ncbi:aquaporin Z [Fluviispira multicolorata]|uniref:Aquaporin Z n=1 Tax=Fluviispira multicolorata TaxID=2654512 RepID=A0A833N848_9BACT|nr:aquaporin Z [Fluviispira multicolorata]KAB8033626.1 aquaporin Z [Fluviispira multicolorata]
MANSIDLKKLFAEFIGTFWLVLGGCGSAVLAAGFPQLGIGFVGVSFAFGLTVLTMAYSIGAISGCHLNPAVSLGLAVAGKFSWKDFPYYVIAQVLGAVIASAILCIIVSGKADFVNIGDFASNGFGEHSPGKFSFLSGFITEIVMTAIFLFVILSSTDAKAPAGFAPIAIGLCLTLIHLISIPVTNTSVNPARSTGPALFVGGWAIEQLWLFWVAPFLGAALGAVTYKFIFSISFKKPVKGK